MLGGEISTNPSRSPRGRRSETYRVNAVSSLWSSSSTTYTPREGDYRSNFKALDRFSFGSPGVDAGYGDKEEEGARVDGDETYESEKVQGRAQGQYQHQRRGSGHLTITQSLVSGGGGGEGGRDGGGSESTPRSSVVIDIHQGIPFTGTGLPVNQSQRSHQSQHTQIQFVSADHDHDIDYDSVSIHSTHSFSQSTGMIPTTLPCASFYTTSTSPNSVTRAIILDMPNEGSASGTVLSSTASALDPATCSLSSTAGGGDITSSPSSTTHSSSSAASSSFSHLSHTSSVDSHLTREFELIPFDMHQYHTHEHTSAHWGDADSHNGSSSDNEYQYQSSSQFAHHDTYDAYDREDEDEEGEDNANSALHCYVGSETQSFVSSDDANADASSYFPPSMGSGPYASPNESGSYQSKRSSGSSGGGKASEGGGSSRSGIGSGGSSAGAGDSGSAGASGRSSDGYPYRDSCVYPGYKEGERFKFDYEYEYRHGGEKEMDVEPDGEEGEGDAEDDVDSDMRIEISSAKFDSDSVVEGPATDERWGMGLGLAGPGGSMPDGGFKRGSQSGWSMDSGRSGKSFAGSSGSGSGSAGSGYGELRSTSLASVVEDGDGYGFDGADDDQDDGNDGDDDEDRERTSWQRRGWDEGQGETKLASEDWRRLLGPVQLSPSPPSSPVLPHFTTPPDTEPPSPPVLCIHPSPPSSSDPAADFDMKYIMQDMGFPEDVDEQKWDFVNPSKTSPTLSSYGFPIPSPGTAKSHAHTHAYSSDRSLWEALEGINSTTGLRIGDRGGTLALKRESSGEESAQGKGRGRRKRSIYFDLPGARGLNVGEEGTPKGKGKAKANDLTVDSAVPKDTPSLPSPARSTATVSPLNTSVTATNNNDSPTPTVSLSYAISHSDPTPPHAHPSSYPNLSLDVHPPSAPHTTSPSLLPNPNSLTSHPPTAFNPYVRRLSGISLQSSASAQSTTSTSMRSSSSFAHDDSFAKSLMAWGGKEYGVMRREWVVRKEKGPGRKRSGSVKTPTQIKRKRSLSESPSPSRDRGRGRDGVGGIRGSPGASGTEEQKGVDVGGGGGGGGGGGSAKSVSSTPTPVSLPTPTITSSLAAGSSSSPSTQPAKAKEDVWRGMTLGEEEIWANLLLGRFVVTREEVGGPVREDSGELKSSGSASVKGRRIIREGKERLNESDKEVGEVKGRDKSGKNERGSRSGQGKLQQRLVIRRLRESPAPSSIAGAAWGSSSVSKYSSNSSPSSTTSPSNPDDETATPKATPSRPRSFSFASGTGAATARLHDPNHPPVIVHKHSKAVAFSLRRQHRTNPGASTNTGTGAAASASGGSGNINVSPSTSPSTKKYPGPAGAATSNNTPRSTASSDSRSHVIMLAQRSVQEAFTNTDIARKVVLDKHQAIMAAFAPGMSRQVKGAGKDEEREGEKEVSKDRKTSVDKGGARRNESVLRERENRVDEKENQRKRLVALGKKKVSSSKLGDRGRTHATSERQIETRNGAAVDLDWVLGGFRGTKSVDVSPPSSSSRGVGTRSAPALSSGRVGSGDEAVVEGHQEVAREDEASWSSHSHAQSLAPHDHKSSSAAHESISDRQQRSRRRLPSFSSQAHVPEPTSSKPSILKRLLPWDTSSSSSSSSRLSSSGGVASTGSSTTAVTTNTTTSTRTFLSVTSASTTPATTVSSELGTPYSTPRVTTSSHDSRKIQRKLIDSLEHSFEDVGLVPTKEKNKARRKTSFSGIESSLDIKGKAGKGSISSKGTLPKNDVLSCVPPEALFMLLPLWPGDTDPHSQKSSPFEVPHMPVEDRKFLLVFYKAFSPNRLEKSAPNQVPSTLLDKHNILMPGFHVIARQVNYSELQGTGVRVTDEGLAVSGSLSEAYRYLPGNRSPPKVPTVQAENDALAANDCVIGSCYSREAGLEFDPEALVQLGLCVELTRENRLLPPGTVVEQFDSEQQMTVKLTPIGSAVMEMVWIGGLALTSFGPV